MDEAMLQGLQPLHRAKVAVAYLIQHKEERPEGSELLFEKLEKHELSMRSIMAAIEQAKSSLRELKSKSEQTVGAIESIADIIAETLPEDKVKEWIEKYEPPTQIPPGAEMAGKGPVKKAEDVDMAGSTSGINPDPVQPPPDFSK